MKAKGLFLSVFMICLLPTVYGLAHDTDLYMSSGEGVEPNILIIFDNSGSMNDQIQAYFYDPAITYPGIGCRRRQTVTRSTTERPRGHGGCSVQARFRVCPVRLPGQP